MHIIKLNLKTRSYNIVIGHKILKSLGKQLTALKIGRDAYVITNATIKNKYGKALAKALKNSGFSTHFKVVPDTERSKSIQTLTSVLKDLAAHDKKKHLFIIAFGGGVVGDLAGFIASIYKRGTPYIQIPTTLLAQVDSSIGGKTAVDLNEGKNLVGAFYQPKLVFSDVGFLSSLNEKQMQSGLAEVIKYAIIKDPKFFRYLEHRHRDILDCNPQALLYIVKECSRIKAAIVSCDEREEKGIRTILNFGHTAGHAIEAAADFKRYAHGEAIALGMLAAADISLKLNLAGKDTVKRIEGLIKKSGLPTKIKKVKLNDIIKAHYRDKKFIGKKNRFVLVQNIGKVKVAGNIPLEIIKAAIRMLI